MNQVKSQLLGLLLGLATAIGVIFYEKLITNFSYATYMLIVIINMIMLFVIGYFSFDNDIIGDYHKITSDIKYSIWIIIYVITAITSFIWYSITKKKGAMVASLYEIKYIVIMAIIYVMFGESKFTMNTAIGAVLALGSIYFISKQ